MRRIDTAATATGAKNMAGGYNDILRWLACMMDGVIRGCGINGFDGRLRVDRGNVSGKIHGGGSTQLMAYSATREVVPAQLQWAGVENASAKNASIVDYVRVRTECDAEG